MGRLLDQDSAQNLLFMSSPLYNSLFLSSLSQHAMRPSRDYGGCSVLRRYFAQLHLLRARFPPDTGQLPIDFVWWVRM